MASSLMNCEKPTLQDSHVVLHHRPEQHALRQQVESPEQTERPTNVLFIIIFQPVRPVTVGDLHTICAPSGNVLRIVIFRNDPVFAFVEFDGVEAAARAKGSLDGTVIYCGRRAVKIRYGKPTKTRLDVYRNNVYSWDYTGVPKRGTGRTERPSLLGPAPGYSKYHDASVVVPSFNSLLHREAPMLIACGLNSQKMNTDRLFNLFCLYGNVVAVKFLSCGHSCAMIQMGDPLAVERALAGLNNAFFFNRCVRLSHTALSLFSGRHFVLNDGTPSFKDFMYSGKNRFFGADAIIRNRVQPPSRILYFFKAPLGTTGEDVRKVFVKLRCPMPATIKVFSLKTGSGCSGLLAFRTVTEAIEALVMANHAPLKRQSKEGGCNFILKMRFSSPGPSR